MCGIVGVAASGNAPPSIDGPALARMSGLLTHRGPDGSGAFDAGWARLGHTRLAIIDRSPAGAQPVATPDGRFVLVYNGELYNDAELRTELARAGVAFRTRCDAETVLWHLAVSGAAGLSGLRGMFAIAMIDNASRRLLIARDPLGIKPLVYTVATVGGRDEVIFASEPRALLAHPEVRARPDAAAVSAYLTTIRTTLDDRTLFAGVRTVRPGEAVTFDLSGDRVLTDRRRFWPPGRAASGPASAEAVRAAVTDSVHRHLRSDVPVCALLSGGLDSSIVATIAAGAVTGLRTYCASSAAGPADPEPDDPRVARTVAAGLGTRHTAVAVTRRAFGDRWAASVAATGVPLSTPNEVAIMALAERIRADGVGVALSGEGADELFGGYDLVLRHAAAFEHSHPHATTADRARASLDAFSWVPVAAKQGLFTPRWWSAAEGDTALAGFIEAELAAAAERVPEGDSAVATRVHQHLVLQRRINLEGLLARLDSSAMLASIETRTPLADAAIADLAESIPLAAKFDDAGSPLTAGRSVPGPDLNRPWSTKRILRAAFARDLPDEVLSRPKASFPLPFRDWLADRSAEVEHSDFLREVFEAPVIAAVAHRPADCWSLAWPMINLALWARRWWG